MSVESEMAVLGCVVLDGEFIKDVANALTPEMFTHDTTRRVFEAMVAQYRANGPVDGVTLVERLPDEKKILLQLAGYVPTTRHRFDYVKIVRDAWRRRCICTAAAEIAADAPICTAQESVERLRNLVAEQDALTRAEGDSGVSFAQAVDHFLQWMNAPKGAPAQSGYGALDRATGGFLPGTVTVLSARSGGGKTDFALNLALHLARRKKKVLYCSMEMPDEQLMQRVASQLMHIDGTRIRDRLLSDEEKGDIERVLCQFRESTRIQFCVEPRLSVDRVRQCIELYQPDILFIDHIGLMERPSMRDAYRALGWVSNQLKQISLDTGLPIVELAQMNRQSDGRRDKRPRLADLRETGDLEQDADYVLFLWRDGEQPQGRLSGEAWTDIHLTLAKNRNGRTGDFRFHWQPQYHTFMEVESKYDG